MDQIDGAKKENWGRYVHTIYEDIYCGLIDIQLSLYLYSSYRTTSYTKKKNTNRINSMVERFI